jgi:ATPase family associated with various cellular activities (AAA)
MGFLSSIEVHEKSATDLIAGFVGQTGLKTVEVLDEALGAVLFIDEAYRLGEGNFATEAVNTLVDSLTKPRYHGKMIVILAGYEGNMNDLLKVNPGLSSRFPEEIIFQNMLPENAFKLLKRKLEEDCIAVDTPEDDQALARIITIFRALSDLPSWGNGRDVETFAKTITRAVFQSADDDGDEDFVVTLDTIYNHLSSFLIERQARETTSALSSRPNPLQLPMAQSTMDTKPPDTAISAQINVSSSQTEEPRPPPPTEVEARKEDQSEPARDPGVSDQVWAQLILNKAAADAETAHLATLSQTTQSIQKANEDNAIKLADLEKHAKAQHATDELKRRHEEMRLRHLEFMAAQRDAENKLRKLEEKRKLEVKAQQKLRDMGICPAGFRWIKEEGGYRCSAGGHFVGDAQLGM